MFDKNFYPTPKHIIEKMIGSDIRDISHKKILEPSAGKGDICDFISSYNPYYRNQDKSNIHCIEKNLDLQAVLKEKKYKKIILL